ncbi:hypothetical protein EUX98_g3695 [Antrodiella citrinella]|uniref:NADP-dependent oxidoreductase domain-containing protein n=1 Tax=Antrodiella citrinella TaxID=2447956 RepID=A0A4V3XIT9_9APHY|nr:hypothetical protein EUX98_g3695 [Antrodiella citrinella]
MSKEDSFKLLDAYYGAGGNFIDMASNYQDGTSEKFISEWMEVRGIRDQIFIATKYTNNINMGEEGEQTDQKAMYVGNNKKSLRLSIEQSLKNLRTDYIDFLYVHWWDYTTSVEEVMDNLHNLVVSEKVLYLGVSDAPAHIVSDANNYAKYNGKTPFSVYQGRWSVLYRDFERKILPMCRRRWKSRRGTCSVVVRSAQMRRRSADARVASKIGRTVFCQAWERDENETKMSRALEKVAKEVGAKHVASVAIAYVMQKSPYVFPLIGSRKVEHLMSNLEALDIALTPEHIQFIDNVVTFDIGFPYSFFGSPDSDYPFLYKTAGHFDR